MRKPQWWALAALLGTLIVVLGVAPPAQSQKIIHKQPQARRQPFSLRGQIVEATRLEEKDIEKVLQAIGPALSNLLASGQQVNIPNLGSFRVVNIPPHRDMAEGGRPIIVPGANFVEFLPSQNLINAANSGGASPAESIPAFQYVPIRDRVPSSAAGTTRIPRTRIR